MSALESFANHFPRRTYHQGTKLFTSKTSSFFLYLISGKVGLSQIGTDGQTIHLHRFYPGSCISLLSLVDNNDNYDFEAETDIEVFQIPKDSFLTELQRDGAVTYELLVHAMGGIKGLLTRVHQANSSSARGRVAGLLAYFARHQSGNDGDQMLTVQVTHQEIAEWLGLSRENVTLQLQYLEEAGFIQRENRVIRILHLEGLQTANF